MRQEIVVHSCNTDHIDARTSPSEQAPPQQAPPEQPLPTSLAPVLGARRDGSATADTSRGLLMTLLGEFVLPGGGAAWTQTLVSALGLLGVREKAGRQALARMEERGFLSRERVGRSTRWSLTPQSTDLLVAGADRIYSFGRSPRAWDGRWLLAFVTVPEADRAVRYRLGQGLTWAGFGSLGQGTWLSPWVDREPAVVSLAESLGVSATTFHATLAELGSGEELVAQAWDLRTLRSYYDGFLEDTASLESGTAEAAVADVAGLVHRWRRFPFLDPDLPEALLPDDWPGSSAAARFSSARTLLRPSAEQWWTDAEACHRPATRSASKPSGDKSSSP